MVSEQDLSRIARFVEEPTTDARSGAAGLVGGVTDTGGAVR